MKRHFEVELRVEVQVKVEVAARSFDEAAEIALDLYDLRDALVLNDEVTGIEEVTAYREAGVL